MSQRPILQKQIRAQNKEIFVLSNWASKWTLHYYLFILTLKSYGDSFLHNFDILGIELLVFFGNFLVELTSRFVCGLFPDKLFHAS